MYVRTYVFMYMCIYICQVCKLNIPEYGGLSGNALLLLESGSWQYDVLSIYGFWNSFRSES